MNMEQNKKKKDIFVVVPTIRETSIRRFLEEWRDEFRKNGVHVIVVEDNPHPSFGIRKEDYDFDVEHYTWEDIDKDLGKSSWIIPRRTSAIKSYGFWKAYQEGADAVVSLDDDCYPPSRYGKRIGSQFSYDLVEEHTKNLFSRSMEEPAWVASIAKVRPRGLPYEHTKRIISPDSVVLSHGLWANIPDFDARTQIALGEDVPHVREYFVDQVIPMNTFFPMCGMNFAWKRELGPAMYFMLMGKDKNEKHWGYDRFDDIWAGIFLKKIIDVLGYRSVSGHPVVWHDRASDPRVNLEKERTGMKVNEDLWSAVDSLRLKASDVAGLYKEIADKMEMGGEYMKALKKAMRTWADLF